jgi:hypothetical protein
MNILLIDADSTIPNLAIMKLSTFYKNINANVTVKRLNIPYYPNKKKHHITVATSNYDKCFCSVIFPGSLQYIHGDNIEFGGTGYSLTKNLPTEIEACEPDYTIYPENNISYGFLSRGCIRNCSFCFVPKKEGALKRVNSVDDIVKHPITKFLDNNFLALPDANIIMQELIQKNIKHQFNQGLDIRLVDKEKSQLLSNLNYHGEYIFAFDNIKYQDIIDTKLAIMDWRKDWQFKFFVYVHPDMPISDTTKRIKYLYKNKCLPYIMRDLSCWESINKNFYTDIAAWCNQPGFFKNMIFSEFMNKRTKNKERIKNSVTLFIEN